MLWVLKRWWSDRQRLMCRMSGVCPNHTRRAVLVMLACMLGAFLLLITVGGSAEEDVSIADELGMRETVTEQWQIIKLSKTETITVWFEHPDPMELGDKISWYCTFEGCNRDNFAYDWQYGDGTYWTSFGSKARKNTEYSAMLAGQQVRLEVSWK